jgi:hypothetical protein
MQHLEPFMNVTRLSIALAASLLVTSVAAQTAGKPLNLKLPPGDAPPSDAPATAHSSASKPAPGVYYGDTSGRIEDDTRVADSAADTGDCDDSTYNQAQMHGSVSTGVVSAGHRGSGSWNAGEVNVTKAFGSCDHPTGGVSISIGAQDGRFHRH